MTFKIRFLIILSINTLLSIIFISSIPFFAYRYLRPTEYKNTGLVTQERFQKELYALLTNNKKNLKDLENKSSIFMVFTQEDGIIYAKNHDDIKKLKLLTNAITEMKIFEKSVFRYRTEPFSYKGESGLFVFMINKQSIIGQIQLYLIPILIIFTILFVIIPALINFKILYTIKMSFFKLEEAVNRVSKGDFDLNLVGNKKGELHSFYNSFNNMGRMLKDNRDQKTRLMMSISHDLKTPLTSMKGYIEAFHDNLVPPEKVRKYLNIIKDKSNLLEDRINTLIDYSKLETDEWKNSFTDIRLKPFLSDIALGFKDDCNIYNREFSYTIIIGNKTFIMGDPKLLMRAIENLLENAKRYTQDNGKIIMDVRENNQVLTISISDTGIGISEEDIKFIFKPFYRIEKGRNSKGMGMGLYTVKSIIENHDGKITCTSKQGYGSRFAIDFSNIYTLNN